MPAGPELTALRIQLNTDLSALSSDVATLTAQAAALSAARIAAATSGQPPPADMSVYTALSNATITKAVWQRLIAVIAAIP